ncbi:MAG: hypothetical protein EYC62_03960 [Alphaproteobacteria bacterium]|nr:MAG: hypothetical protein EYC62_03960 [Alphaproteobacteria bacterium]
MWRRTRRKRVLPTPNIYPDGHDRNKPGVAGKIGFYSLIAASIFVALAFPFCYAFNQTLLWQLGLSGYMGIGASICGVIAPIILASASMQRAEEIKNHQTEQTQFSIVRLAQKNGAGLAVAKSVRRSVEKSHRHRRVIFFWPKIIGQLVEADLLDQRQVDGWRARNEELRQRWIKREWPDYDDTPSIATKTADAAGRLARRIGRDLQR